MYRIRYDAVQGLILLSNPLAFTRYRHDQSCMLNGKTGGAGENHILRNIDCENTARGGCKLEEVLNANTSIDQCTISEYTNEYIVKAKQSLPP